jgi:hypothetical protein
VPVDLLCVCGSAPDPWAWSCDWPPDDLDVDRGLSEILLKFGAGALDHLLGGSPVAGYLWWSQISGSVPVDLDLGVSSCGSGV